MNDIYNRSVSFRDKNKNRWTIKIEVRNSKNTKQNCRTLEFFDEHYEVSVCGEGGYNVGQCYDSIVPRTETQAKLLDFWQKYHLNGMKAGTVAQDEFLSSDLYKQNYDDFLEMFSGYNQEFRQDFDSVSEGILFNYYMIPVKNLPTVRTIIAQYMSGNPIKYILGIPPYSPAHDMNDLYVKYLFLAIHGLYNDRGYEYGHGWLFEPLPENITMLIDEICDHIEKEEEMLTDVLGGVFNMGDENFEPNQCIVEQVMNLRDCDEKEAKRFLALGMTLSCTFGDLNDTFEKVSDEYQQYRANGIEYHIGTDSELEDIADTIVHEDGAYEDYWREAVASKQTEDSLKNWLNDLIAVDGWCSILNHWDGNYDSHNIAGDVICVCRT